MYFQICFNIKVKKSKRLVFFLFEMCRFECLWWWYRCECSILCLRNFLRLARLFFDEFVCWCKSAKSSAELFIYYNWSNKLKWIVFLYDWSNKLKQIVFLDKLTLQLRLSTNVQKIRLPMPKIAKTKTVKLINSILFLFNDLFFALSIFC